MDRLVDPERELALSYAPREACEHLRALWLVDERFGAIVAGTTDPIIGEMRLLWWREALAAVSREDRAEPLLERVKAAIDETGGDGAEWGAMAEGWHALLQEPIQQAELDRFARDRGARLFSLSAGLLDHAPGPPLTVIEDAGKAWALTDLSFRHSNPETSRLARSIARALLEGIDPAAWPKSLRTLGVLTVLARRDSRSGAFARRQGAPGRVMRMLSYRIFGR